MAQAGRLFFREPGEYRTGTGKGPRIVRVGTHALKVGAGTTLWKRLSQHKGRAKSGGGNHRGSIFRLIVGTALMDRNDLKCASWDEDKSTDDSVKLEEFALERHVSKVIGAMPFLWLAIDDEAGPNSKRGYIEKNSITLLSNYRDPPIDRPSNDWLGRHCNREKVKRSGQWNSDHVDDDYDPAFLDLLQELVVASGTA